MQLVLGGMGSHQDDQMRGSAARGLDACPALGMRPGHAHGQAKPPPPCATLPSAVSILLLTALCFFSVPEPCALALAPLPAMCREDQEAEAVCGEPEIPPQEDDLSAGSGDGYSGDTLEASPSPAPLRLRASMRRRRAA